MNYNISHSNFPLDWWRDISTHLEERGFRKLWQCAKYFQSATFVGATPKHQEWINAMASRAIANIFESNQKLITEAFQKESKIRIVSIFGSFSIALIGSFFGSYPTVRSILGNTAHWMLFGKIKAYNDLTDELKNAVTSFQFRATNSTFSFELEAAALRGAIQLFPNAQAITLKGRIDDNRVTAVCKQKIKELRIDADHLYNPVVTGSHFNNLPDSIEKFICRNSNLDSVAITKLSHLKNLKKLDITGNKVTQIPECLKNRSIIVKL